MLRSFILRVAGQLFAEFGQGLIPPALFSIEHAKAVAQFGKLRVSLLQLLVSLDRFIFMPLIGEHFKSQLLHVGRVGKFVLAQFYLTNTLFAAEHTEQIE